MLNIEFLRNLADKIDLHLGVASRKHIFEGHEKLTICTDKEAWEKWLSGVMKRINTATTDDKTREKIMKIIS